MPTLQGDRWSGPNAQLPSWPSLSTDTSVSYFHTLGSPLGPHWGSVSTPTVTTTTSAVGLVDSAFVTTSPETIGISAMFSVKAATSDPTYLVLVALDRNEYAVTASGDTGTLSGNGHSLSLTSVSSSSDAREAGIVFTYDSASGRYYNVTYGYFDQLTYTSSSSEGDVTTLSVYTTSSYATATKYASDVYTLAKVDASGYAGSATVVTDTDYSGAQLTQATPDSVCSVALSYVGKAWNINGCWTLANTIATEAGASLPLDSTLVGVSGQANGEWIVVYDGTKQAGDWKSLLKAGEVVVIGTSSSGHIFTVVSGSGTSAVVVDNITYESSSGTILNAANDGSSSDIVITEHAVSQEFSGVNASLVKIYELDTPIVSTLVTSYALTSGASLALSRLFSVSDPANKAITQYQVYDTAATDSLTVNGTVVAAHTAGTATTATSLSQVCLVAGSTACTDTLEVRAYNGTYWGDWEALAVSVTGVSAATAALVA